MFDCSRWFIQLCYVTIGNVPFFPFQGFLCRCYKSGATTKDYSFYMLIAAEKMADNFRSAIARVHRIGDNKGIKQRKQAMLWLFQVFALTAGWSVRLSSMGHFFSDIWFLKNPPHMSFTWASWKDSWVSRNVLILTACSTKVSLLKKVVRADPLIANRSDTWTYQVLHALQDFPTSQQFLNAIRSHESINLKQLLWTLFARTYHRELEGTW